MEQENQTFSGSLRQLADAARRGRQNNWVQLAISTLGSDAHARAINFYGLLKNEAAEDTFEIDCLMHSADYLEFHFYELDKLPGKVVGKQNDEVPRGMIRIGVQRQDGRNC